MNCVCVQMGGDGFLFCGLVTGELWVMGELGVTGKLCAFRWGVGGGGLIHGWVTSEL